ncbi:WAT1-related protein [Mucuna pruriens]|uniref:WAT1-related protein n=1 Tax=Mucuna pruriens TaxID=157652 RepID=A0A371FNZ0_MUCPR|nr:WAT1-related protein [Mucuna pruriens]
MAGHKQKLVNRLKSFIGVVFLQFGYAGMDVLSKAALNKGMSNYVFVVYRHVFAFVVMAPFALVLEKKVRPKMTFSIFMKIVVLSLLEPVIDQNLYFLGMKYTTATFAASMYNVLPAITFLMAWILSPINAEIYKSCDVCNWMQRIRFNIFLSNGNPRLEKIKLKSMRSHAKVVGTLATVAGAMVMTLIKGPALDLFGTHGSNTHSQQNGGAITIEAYPAELSLTTWICLLGTLEGGVVALIMERKNPSAWSLNWDTKLLAAVYSGIVCSGMAYYIQGAVMKDRGPVFVTTFSPLCMVIVAIMGSIFLAEQMYLGRAVGAIVIILGLYLVVWGKSKEYESSSSITKEDILPSKQTVDDSNGKEEHSNCELTTLSNLSAGNIARDEQIELDIK